MVAVADLFAVTPAELGPLPPAGVALAAAAVGAVTVVVVDVVVDAALAVPTLATEPPAGAVVPRPSADAEG